MPENQEQGVTRRELLRRGAALGGAVVWATPVVQTLGMGRAFAQTASPTDISYIAMNITCGQDQYFIKWEAPGTWEMDPKETPGCTFTPVGDMVAGDDLLIPLDFSVNIESDGSATVSWTVDCVIDDAAVKGGQLCDVHNGPFATSPQNFPAPT